MGLLTAMKQGGPTERVAKALGLKGPFRRGAGLAAVMLDPRAVGADLGRVFAWRSETDLSELPVVLYVPGRDVQKVLAAHQPVRAGEYWRLTKPAKPCYAARRGSYVLISPMPKALKLALAAKASAATELTKRQLAAFAKADVALHVNMRIDGADNFIQWGQITAMFLAQGLVYGEPLVSDIVETPVRLQVNMEISRLLIAVADGQPAPQPRDIRAMTITGRLIEEGMAVNADVSYEGEDESTRPSREGRAKLDLRFMFGGVDSAAAPPPHGTGVRQTVGKSLTLKIEAPSAWIATVMGFRSVAPTRQARHSALVSDLQTIRSQLELYKIQHLDQLPGVNAQGAFDEGLFVGQLTGMTDSDGRVRSGDGNSDSHEYPLGPYLQQFPANPFVAGPAGRKIAGGARPTSPRDGSTGWYFNTVTGGFWRNDKERKRP